MVETLRARWRREMPFKGMIRLRDDLDEMLQRIRSFGKARQMVQLTIAF
jgi:hypothetical protein